MDKNFHEQYAADAVPMQSERSTGLVFTSVAIIVAYFGRSDAKVAVVGLAIAASLLAASLLAPSMLRPLNKAWFNLAVLLNKIMSPVVMLVLFLVAIVPAGIIMQAKRDPLRKRRNDDVKSYWIERGKDWPANNMTNQF